MEYGNRYFYYLPLLVLPLLPRTQAGLCVCACVWCTEQYDEDVVDVSVSVDGHVVGRRPLTYTFSSLRLAGHISAFYCRMLDVACRHHRRHHQPQQVSESGGCRSDVDELDEELASITRRDCTTPSLACSRLFSVYQHCSRNNTHQLFTLAASSGERNVTVWRPSVRPSVCPVGIFTVTHQGVACDAASVHYGPTLRRSDILVYRTIQCMQARYICRSNSFRTSVHMSVTLVHGKCPQAPCQSSGVPRNSQRIATRSSSG